MQPSFLKEQMKVHTRNVFLVLLLALVISTAYAAKGSYYVLSAVGGPIQLDLTELKNRQILADVSANSGHTLPKDGTAAPRTMINDKKMASSWAMYYIYIQDHRYLFRTAPTPSRETGVRYNITDSLRLAGAKVADGEYKDSRILLMEFDDFLMPVRVPYSQEIDYNASFQGLLNKTPWFIERDIAGRLDNGQVLKNVSDYMLDTTGVDEVCKIEFFRILALLGTWCFYLLIKILLNTFKPVTHQMYRQMYRLYGTREEICQSIETEYADKATIITEKNKITTPSWIIKKGLFRTKITTNLANLDMKKDSLRMKF